MELNNFSRVVSQEETLFQAGTSPGYNFSTYVSRPTAYIVRSQKALENLP
jgi:hypothetical protein